ncbi:MAG: zinc ribbon domain-containing protein, partial [Nitrospinaceae bacterium]|nr:zinc ribbon domain-containing protein [Nitrospinaceae bacterium]
KEISAFALTGGASGDEAEDSFDFDEQKMEGALDALAGEAETLNEDDPKAAATLMRKFSRLSGLKFNDGIEEAIGRLEAGEDPDAIESELGSLLDSEDPFVAGSNRDPRNAAETRRRKKAPRRDPTLHDL